MRKRLSELICPLMGWHVVSVVWLVLAVQLGGMSAFRAVTHSGMAQTFDFGDVPFLRFCNRNYAVVYWLALGLGAGLVVALGAACHWLCEGGLPAALRSPRRAPRQARLALGLLATVALFVVLGLVASRYSLAEGASVPDLEPTGPIDWLLVVLAPAGACLLVALTVSHSRQGRPSDVPLRPEPVNVPTRLGTVYLLGVGAVIVYALLDHVEFWNPAANGGYDYTPYFLGDEIASANLVLYSTSLLFASIAAVAGCVGYLVFRRLSRRGRESGVAMGVSDCWRQAFLLALFWSFALGAPWQLKLLPEIRAENGWIMPAMVLSVLAAALAPMLLVTLLMLKRDFDEACAAPADAESGGAPNRYPRRSELAFSALLLFAVYPYLRLLRVRWARMNRIVLILVEAGAIAALTWFVNVVDELFEFDDWRGMMRATLFPFLQVLMSLLAAYFVYLCGQGAWSWWRERRRGEGAEPPRPALGLRLARTTVLVLVVVCLGLATSPFWMWGRVRKNVFARLYEYSDRHKFDLQFLHWLFDFDRDGYAAVLHGADPDDFDANVLPGGLGPPGPAPVPVDEFELGDRGEAARFPNLVILYLEGITPRAISAYGMRHLPDGLAATPHMDSVAAEGTRFTQARCFYPSTWDAWFSVNSGRFLKIAEMHLSQHPGDRYSSCNSLYKILELVGINRWCHADTSPYQELFVPEGFHEGREPPWQPEADFDSRVSAEEEERGIRRGDRRNQRILGFLDDLKPGDRFFVCEHMSDTHFPWKRTPHERAVELGFPHGLEIYEEDAVLPNGGRSDTYSRYFQSTTRMDAQVGQILDKLKERGLYDNTMIVIVSDHGCQWWEHEHMYYVSHLYDQALLVPLIIRVPGLPGGIVRGEPVLQIDVLATIQELAGVRHANPHPDYPRTCRSLLPLMKTDRQLDKKTTRQYWDRDMPLTTHFDKLGVISRFHHKLIFDRTAGTYRLFDLKEDPEEMHNLADERPQLLDEMFAKLSTLMRRHKSITGRLEPMHVPPAAGRRHARGSTPRP